MPATLTGLSMRHPDLPLTPAGDIPTVPDCERRRGQTGHPRVRGRPFFLARTPSPAPSLRSVKHSVAALPRRKAEGPPVHATNRGRRPRTGGVMSVL